MQSKIAPAGSAAARSTTSGNVSRFRRRRSTASLRFTLSSAQSLSRAEPKGGPLSWRTSATTSPAWMRASTELADRFEVTGRRNRARALPRALRSCTCRVDYASRDFALGRDDREQEAQTYTGGTELRLLRRIGRVDPESLEAYRADGGYAALARAFELGPQAIVGRSFRGKAFGARRRRLSNGAKDAGRGGGAGATALSHLQRRRVRARHF